MHRSLLFVPGDRPERFDRALASGASAVVIDLEDAVQPDAKAAARANIAAWLKAGGTAVVRINAIGTEWHKDDMALQASPGISAVMLPMVEDAATLAAFIAALPAPLPVIALIETARGVWGLESLVAVKGISRLGFGSIDFQLDTGIEDEDHGLLYARSRIVLASTMAGLQPPLDGVSVDLDNIAGLEADTARAKGLGFGGKLCIHPKQVAAVNAGFAATAAELDWAKEVVAVSDAAGARGAIRLRGKLIDAPVVARARQLLEAET